MEGVAVRKTPKGKSAKPRTALAAGKNAAPRTALAGVKKRAKPKPPKVPRNPFRRSDTGKLKLKSLQMRKRIETLTPRAESLRERLYTTETRLNFLIGKVKLVDEELASREDGGDATGPDDATGPVDAIGSNALAEHTLDADASGAESYEEDSSDEEIELDDEIEPLEDEIEPLEDKRVRLQQALAEACCLADVRSISKELSAM
jgi:chromosome segregation ATPase